MSIFIFSATLNGQTFAQFLLLPILLSQYCDDSYRFFLYICLGLWHLMFCTGLHLHSVSRSQIQKWFSYADRVTRPGGSRESQRAPRGSRGIPGGSRESQVVPGRPRWSWPGSGPRSQIQKWCSLAERVTQASGSAAPCTRTNFYESWYLKYIKIQCKICVFSIAWSW